MEGSSLNSIATINREKNIQQIETIVENESEETDNTIDIPDSDAKEDKDLMGLIDGNYLGVGSGFAGDIIVEVTVIDGTISKVNVVDHSEDYQWFSYAYDIVSDNIIKEQTPDVDMVSGATYSLETANKNFNKFSLVIWVIWLISFVLGMLVGMNII